MFVKRVIFTKKGCRYYSKGSSSTSKCRHYQKGSSLLVKRVVFTKIKGVNECRLAITKEGNFLIKVCQRTTGGVCYGRSGQKEDSRRSRGQREESRTAGGFEDSGRS